MNDQRGVHCRYNIVDDDVRTVLLGIIQFARQTPRMRLKLMGWLK